MMTTNDVAAMTKDDGDLQINEAVSFLAEYSPDVLRRWKQESSLGLLLVPGLIAGKHTESKQERIPKGEAAAQLLREKAQFMCAALRQVALSCSAAAERLRKRGRIHQAVRGMSESIVMLS